MLRQRRRVILTDEVSRRGLESDAEDEREQLGVLPRKAAVTVDPVAQHPLEAVVGELGGPSAAGTATHFQHQARARPAALVTQALDVAPPHGASRVLRSPPQSSAATSLRQADWSAQELHER